MTPGVTSPPLSYEISSRNPSPLPLGLLPYPALEGSEDSRASFYLRGVDFLGVSEQEGDEGCDLSVSSATPFWSPVNFRSMRPGSLGLGWAWVLVEGPTQLLWERKRQEGSYPPDQNRAPLECLHHQPSTPLPACCLFRGAPWPCCCLGSREQGAGSGAWSHSPGLPGRRPAPTGSPRDGKQRSKH